MRNDYAALRRCAVKRAQLLGDVFIRKPVKAEALKAFESDVRRLHEVRSVSFEFTNWVRNDSGAWICRDSKKTPEQAATKTDSEPHETADAY